MRYKGGTMKSIVTCDNCGKQFETWPSDRVHARKFCSKACNGAYYSGDNNPNRRNGFGVTLICEHCGNEYVTSPSKAQRSQHHFCSEQHRKDWLSALKKHFVCETCGKDFIPIRVNKYTRFCSNVCKGVWHSGSNHEWYVDGGGRPVYNKGFHIVRREVRKRDKNACRLCGGTGILLDVHHIDHNPKNDDLDNLLLLCRTCHVRETLGKGLSREQWERGLRTTKLLNIETAIDRYKLALLLVDNLNEIKQAAIKDGYAI